ncbi:MAG: class I SAM-dependent methyltransferase [Elusimicrobia bacterium]|nr:class I SAM-dependent methyltransferase [Elusimicrobiota bacterium]
MTAKMDAEQTGACMLCGKLGLSPVPKPEKLLGVTSDDRPWKGSGSILVCSDCGHVQKQIDEHWRRDAAEVYRGYALYQLRGGTEHVVLGDVGSRPRSCLLLDRLRDQIGLSKKGRMLDVGCGNGPLLRSFGEMFPQWSLVGFEPSDHFRSDVEAIPGVEAFHSGTMDRIPGSFDLIALYYVLEHLPDPARVIADLRAKLAPGGLFVIIVPHYQENPFDLIIVDHCSHFRMDSLSFLLKVAGLEVLEVTTGWIPRAVAAVGRNSALKYPGAIEAEPFLEIRSRVCASLDWLNRLIDDASVHAKADAFGIFGTATAGSWIAGVLGERVAFFVDEDWARTGVGKSHLGRPVYLPHDAPPDKSIYLAFPPALAKGMFDRLQLLYPNLRFILPPMASDT